MAKILSSKSEFENDILNTSLPAMVDFFATWCGPCKMLAPVFDEASQEVDATFVKVDIDQSLEIAQRFNITTVPTMMIFKNGQKVDSMVGFMPKEKLVEKVKSHL